jgi:hypothetical protein
MVYLNSKQFKAKKGTGGGGKGKKSFFPQKIQFRSCNEEEYRGKVFPPLK